MRTAFKLALCLAPAVLAQSNFVPCDQQSVDQCALSCNCQRVACCCGPNCDKLGSAVLYNRCVAVGSDASTWNCPSIESCASFGGRAMTITPCVPNTNPTPSSPTPGPAELEFGTTFPMTGTQEVPKQTWQHNVYMGTTMKFNKGAYFSYTDSFYVPNWNAAQYDSAGNQIIVPGVPGGDPRAPTPAIDYTGVPCFIANPCPTGYYCKLNPGNNIQQKGSCARVSSDYWSGGAGQWTDSDMYSSMIHPPLILDPTHNGPASSGSSGSSYDIGLGYNPGYNPGSSGNAYGQPTIPMPNSCASPSVCGYKAAYGTCWCDSKCQTTGDCCPDIKQYCDYVPHGGAVTTGSSIANGNCIQDNGQCSGRCGSKGPVTVGSQTCYCDVDCRNYNDCCCSAC